jgi:phage terminase small subunit
MRKKTTKQKKLNGTYRKDRAQSSAPVPAPANVGEPPARFTASQRAAWRELAPQVAAVFTTSDRSAFALLVKQHAALEAPAAAKMPHYVRAALVRSVASLLEAFGCTPASRGRVEAVQAADEPDESERFLFGNMRPAEPPKVG